MGETTYCLQPITFFVLHDRDDDRRTALLFHVSAGDYFGTLASIISLLQNQTDDRSAILDHLRQDLIYLQHRYKIVPKNNPIKDSPNLSPPDWRSSQY